MKTLKIFNNELVNNAVSNTDEIIVSYKDSNFSDIITSMPNSCVEEINVFQLYPTDAISAQLFRILKPKSKISFHYCIQDREKGQELSTDLKIQGFEDIMVAKDTSTQDRFLVCQKPEFDFNATVPLKSLKLKNKSGTSANEQKTWKMALQDLAEDDLIDENDLKDDLIMTPLPTTSTNDPSDCGTGAVGKKRACANCSCGLAELEKSEQENGILNNENVSIAKSACGNCFKGDAFRCGGCPFSGKPAFEPGQEKLVLSLSDDM